MNLQQVNLTLHQMLQVVLYLLGIKQHFTAEQVKALQSPKWDVTPPTVRTLATNVVKQVQLLHMLGIAFTFEMSMRESYLVINATNITDGSIVQCEVEER